MNWNSVRVPTFPDFLGDDLQAGEPEDLLPPIRRPLHAIFATIELAKADGRGATHVYLGKYEERVKAVLEARGYQITDVDNFHVARVQWHGGTNVEYLLGDE